MAMAGTRLRLHSSWVAALFLVFVACMGPCSASWQQYSHISQSASWETVERASSKSTAFLLDPSVLHKAFVNFGDRGMYQRAMCEQLLGGEGAEASDSDSRRSRVRRALSASGSTDDDSAADEGACLTIVAMGGSFTCGSSLNKSHPDSPSGKSDAWPAVLEKDVNERYPRKGCSHVVHNVCNNGANTAVHISRSSEKEIHEKLLAADVVIVETSINDLETSGHMRTTSTSAMIEKETAKSHGKASPLPHASDITRTTEVFINLLLSLKKKPMILYLGVSTRIKEESYKTHKWPRGSDAVHIHHLPVTKYYGIPHLSVMDALGPTFFSPARREWLESTYLTDSCCHGTKQGQALVSTFIMYGFSAFLKVCEVAPVPVFKEDLEYAKRRPLFVPQSVIDEVVKANPYHLKTIADLDKPFRTGSSGFEALEDVPGKPGYIATEVGSYATYVMGADILKEHMLHGILQVMHLKSYNHMGVMRVEVSALPPSSSSEEEEDDPIELAEQVVDCLWDAPVSEPMVAELSWDIEAVPPGSSLQVKVKVVKPGSDQRSRSEHKVKLTEFVMY